MPGERALIIKGDQVKQDGSRDLRALETGSDPIEPDQKAPNHHTPRDTRLTGQDHKVITGKRPRIDHTDLDRHPEAENRTEKDKKDRDQKLKPLS